MDSTSNAFSYAVGGLALFSTLASVLLYSRTYLPGAQMKVLDDLLVETRQIYEKASTEGLLPPDVSSVAYFKLLRFESEGDTLREITYRALSSFDKLWDLFRGHTTKIMRLANNVGALRAMLMTTSQKEKARRIAEEREAEAVANSGNSPNDATLGSHRNINNYKDSNEHRYQCSHVNVSIESSSTISEAPFSTFVTEPNACASCCICAAARWWSRISRPKQPRSHLSSIGTDELPTSIAQDSDHVSLSSTIVGNLSSTPPQSRWPSVFQWARSQRIRPGDVSDPNDSDIQATSMGGNSGQYSPKLFHDDTMDLGRDIGSLPV